MITEETGEAAGERVKGRKRRIFLDCWIVGRRNIIEREG